MKSFDKDKLIRFIEVTNNIKYEVENCDWVDSYKKGQYLEAYEKLINACFVCNEELYKIGSALQLHMQKMNIKIVKDQKISGDLLWNDGILKLAIKSFEEEEN